MGDCQPCAGGDAAEAGRFLIGGYWVGDTKAWVIPGTEDLTPYISKADKRRKWLAGAVGMAIISAVLAGIGMLL